jgi:5-(carboxyamino)imidazole ribonucleotide mutase
MGAMSSLSSSPPVVGVVMGSDSDWSVMRDARDVLEEFGVPYEVEVVSAHRTPEKMIDYGRAARGRGHLPGMLAAVTELPVIGVPVPLARLDGLDSLLSIVQMPGGVPVATVSIGGAKNAGLLAVQILGTSDDALADAMAAYQVGLADTVAEKNDALKKTL